MDAKVFYIIKHLYLVETSCLLTFKASGDLSRSASSK